MKNKINSNFIIKQIKNKKGFALLGTLILVFVVSTFGIALLTMTQNDIKLSTLQKASKETFYIAESGIEHAISYLEEMGTPNFDTPTNPFYTEENLGYLDMGNGKYEVTIESYSTFSYIIQSTGIRPWTNTNGEIIKKIECKVILENFAMYAYFSDNEYLPVEFSGGSTNTKIWFYGEDHIRGPLHSNDRLHMAGGPTFDGPVTSSWVNPTDPDDVSWEAYDAQTDPNFLGDPGYQGGLATIPLPEYREISDPTDSQSLQRIAAGSEEFIDTHGNGVYVPYDVGSNNVTDGIWVKGGVNSLTLGTTYQGNSKITITQGTTTTIVYTLETAETFGSTTYPAGTTLIYSSSGGGSYTPRSGSFNGILYVDGNVDNLKSTSTDGGLKGKLTIASDSTITISNNLLYNTRVNDLPGHNCFDVPAGTYPDIPDSLGLVSQKNIMVDNDAPNDLEINAIIMALGTSFYYEGWKNNMQGVLTVHGSFIQKQRGPVGTFNSWGKQSGYTKDYQFDTRMSIDNSDLGQVLPPYFPTTGKYIKLYWKEVD